jgi:hypothetical protein
VRSDLASAERAEALLLARARGYEGIKTSRSPKRRVAPSWRVSDPGLAAEGWFRTEHMTYPYGVQIGVVRVDSDTGEATVERFLLAYDRSTASRCLRCAAAFTSILSRCGVTGSRNQLKGREADPPWAVPSRRPC